MRLITHPYLPSAHTLCRELQLLHATQTVELTIGILNLMPEKEQAEQDLLRLLSGTSRPVKVIFLRPATHSSKNCPAEHLNEFYTTWQSIKPESLDGLLVNGAPLEYVDYSDVTYMPELRGIIADCDRIGIPTLGICWGALALMWLRYGIDKIIYPHKLSGVYMHRLIGHGHPLVNGFDDMFHIPHSRNAGVRPDDLYRTGLLPLAVNPETGPAILASHDGLHCYVLGHPEYAPTTLHREYMRDSLKGLNPRVPANYYPGDDPSKTPLCLWRSHGRLLGNNWLEICANHKNG